MDSSELPTDEMLFQALASISEGLGAMASTIRGLSSGCSHSTGIEMRRFGSRTIFSAFVEVTFNPGDTFCWWFEVLLDEGRWSIDRHVSRAVSNGQEVLLQLDDKNFDSACEFASAVPHLVEEFSNTIGTVVPPQKPLT